MNSDSVQNVDVLMVLQRRSERRCCLQPYQFLVQLCPGETTDLVARFDEKHGVGDLYTCKKKKKKFLHL